MKNGSSLNSRNNNSNLRNDTVLHKEYSFRPTGPVLSYVMKLYSKLKSQTVPCLSSLQAQIQSCLRRAHLLTKSARRRQTQETKSKLRSLFIHRSTKDPSRCCFTKKENIRRYTSDTQKRSISAIRKYRFWRINLRRSKWKRSRFCLKRLSGCKYINRVRSTIWKVLKTSTEIKLKSGTGALESQTKWPACRRQQVWTLR